MNKKTTVSSALSPALSSAQSPALSSALSPALSSAISPALSSAISPAGFEIVLDPKNGRNKSKCPICGGLYVGNATPKKHQKEGCPPSRRSTVKQVEQVEQVEQYGGSLKTLMEDAIENGIRRGFNIIYDTTFAGNTNKFDGIMNILIKYTEHKYTILVIHITALESEIVNRIKRRHLHMINRRHPEENRYLRAIRPTLTGKRFIPDNKDGFIKVREKYKNPDTFKGTHYSPEDFMFKAFINPEGNSPKINRDLMSSTSPKSPRSSTTSPTRKRSKSANRP
jgi:hypothetical protein